MFVLQTIRITNLLKLFGIPNAQHDNLTQATKRIVQIHFGGIMLNAFKYVRCYAMKLIDDAWGL